MSTRRLNLWPWAFVLCVVTGIAAMQQLDAQPTSYDADAAAERRMWAHAVAHCHRAFGPQTAPEYDHDDNLVCVGKRGQRMAAVHPADAKASAPASTAPKAHTDGVKVASK